MLNAVLWALVLAMFPRNSPAVVMHYSIDVGIDFIGEGKQIIMLPIAGLVIAGINMQVGWLLRRSDPGSAYVAWAMGPIAQVLLLGAFALIWRANT